MTYQGDITRSEWGALIPYSNNGPQYTDEGLIIHWEGPTMGWPWDHSQCTPKVQGIQSYHMNHGYHDIAYNDVVCPHGYIFQARSGIPHANAASGTDQANRHAWAACALWGEGDGDFPQDGLDAIVVLRDRLIAAGAGLSVRGHRDVIATACPGDQLDGFASQLDGQPPSGGVMPGPGPGPSPGVPEWPGTLLVNYTSNYGTSQWQQQMANRGWSIDVDDMYGSQSERVCRQFQAEKGLDVDGVVGPITWNAAWTAPIT